MYVVTFIDFTPPARYDTSPTPWTGLTIEEGPAEAGPWTLIDTQALSPTDTDPSAPMSRNFSTALATLLNGWYRVIFTDGLGNQAIVDPVHNINTPWVPSLPQVGGLLRARTKDDAGNELGTFTSATRPTAAEANELVQQAADTFLLRAGDDIPQQLWEESRRVVALRAAMLIELSYFPEQVTTGRSPYASYENLWCEAYGDQRNKGVLIQAIEAAKRNPDKIVNDEPGIAQFSFPPTENIARRPW
jgi:hypothetical protein